MLLSYEKLIQLVWSLVLCVPRKATDGSGKEVISPIDIDQVNSSSIDLTLGPVIKREMVPEDGYIVSLRDRNPMRMLDVHMDDDGYVLEPGEFILAHTVERFNLPLNISGEYKLKSSMARIALEHLNAGWADAGWHGSALTLELKNVSRYHSIRIRPGDRIGQIVFFEHEEVPADRSYAARGRYNNDSTVSAIKP